MNTKSKNEEPMVPVAFGSFVNVAPAPDGIHTVVVFKIGEGVSGVALKPDDLSALVTTALTSAAESAAITSATVKQGLQPTKVPPISVASIGVAAGRSETEVLLSVQVGPLMMSFATDLSVLQCTLENLMNVTKHIDKPKPN